MKKSIHKRAILYLLIGSLLLLAAGGWLIHNQIEDHRAGQRADEILAQMQKQPEDQPLIRIEGEEFCGRIAIEQLGIELPIFDKWSYQHLKEAPCRYSGSLEAENLIIAAHNYKNHFGALHTLTQGDSVFFIDCYGKKHSFYVDTIEILSGAAIEEMRAGDWDLTLFTCTKGGKQRATIRCIKSK